MRASALQLSKYVWSDLSLDDLEVMKIEIVEYAH